LKSKEEEETPLSEPEVQYTLNHGYLLGHTFSLVLPASIGLGVLLAETS